VFDDNELKNILAKCFWLGLSSAMIAVFSGFGLVRAFNEDIFAVGVCLSVFILSYKMSQIGLHNGNNSHSIIWNKREWFNSLSKIDMIYLTGGTFLMSGGFIILTRSIVQEAIFLSASAAVLMGSGYILAHWVINNTLV